jgi:hypothetical protein
LKRSVLKKSYGDYIDFVIVGAMRTGSNLLQEKLNNFSDIKCLGEICNIHLNRFDSFFVKKIVRKYSIIRKESRIYSLIILRKIIFTSIFSKYKTGFRLFRNHNRNIENRVLNNKDIKKIILYRDLIDTYISLEQAKTSGKWIRRDNQSSPLIKVDFSITKFQEYVLVNQDFYQSVLISMKEFSSDYIQVEYNDLLDNLKIEEIARFIGAQSPMTSGETILKKQNRFPREQVINNYDEVKEYLESFNQTVFD